jgi:hypothetical protein
MVLLAAAEVPELRFPNDIGRKSLASHLLRLLSGILVMNCVVPANRYGTAFVYVVEKRGFTGWTYLAQCRSDEEARRRADKWFASAQICRTYNNVTGEVYQPELDPLTKTSEQRLEFEDNPK